MTEQANVDMIIAAYFRTSSKAQSVQPQYAAAKWVLDGVPAEQIKTYEDLSVSAKSDVKDRPALQELMKDITDKRVTQVVVYDRERIAREPAEWIDFWHLCNAHNIAISFTSYGHPPMDSNFFAEALYMYMLGVERKEISQRIRMAKAAASRSKLM